MFNDGNHFAFAIRTCNLCKACAVSVGKACPTPEKVRPCDQIFGIDVYQTVREIGFHCNVLQDNEDLQNRYGFVLINAPVNINIANSSRGSELIQYSNFPNPIIPVVQLERSP